MYYVISMTHRDKVSHRERKALLKSLFGSPYEHKKGAIYKFNNAIGFANVVEDIFTDYPVVRNVKEVVPENYEAPYYLFLNGLYIDMSAHGIIKFIIEDKLIEHPKAKYTYHTSAVVEKFVNYLKKVYPLYGVFVKQQERVRISKVADVLNHFYLDIDFDSSIYEVECSSDRLLTNEEIAKIEKVLKECVTYPFHIAQFYCETCASYHKDSPYHIQIDYD